MCTPCPDLWCQVKMELPTGAFTRFKLSSDYVVLSCGGKKWFQGISAAEILYSASFPYAIIPYLSDRDTVFRMDSALTQQRAQRNIMTTSMNLHRHHERIFFIISIIFTSTYFPASFRFSMQPHTLRAAGLLLIQVLHLSLAAVPITKFNYCFNYTTSP